MKEVIVIGSSGHSKVIIDIFEKSGYKIIGLIDSFRNIGEKTLGYNVIGGEEDMSDLMIQYDNAELFIAIGDNYTRMEVYNKLSPNVKFANAIHPSAQIGKNVTIGNGVAIMAGAIVGSDSNIGDFTIINTKASIDHDSILSKFASLAPSATTGGNVEIGEYSAISIGAIVIHGIKIGNHSVLGAGALLLNDLGNNLISYGIPAKEIRNRGIGEKYL